MDWRLSGDLGTNSLGWAAIRLDHNGDPDAILDLGARIFSDGRDPKTKASLALDRRVARAMRRRRDRFKQRQRALTKYLIRDGLFPADAQEAKRLEHQDPYALRAKGLEQPLTPFEIGRVFFHLNQRRGFQSNRIADRVDNNESGKIAIGIDRLRQIMAEKGARTYGEFLHLRRVSASDENHIPGVRTRLRPETGENAKGDGYDFYPGRDLLKEEFDALWEVQAEHHHTLLTPEVHDRLFEIVFGQRPLKSPVVGKCTLLPEERRLPKAHPLFQRRRLLEEINSLMIIEPGKSARPLDLAERNLLLLKLKDSRSVTFASLRTKVLKLSPEARFNKEGEHRSEIKGDEVAAELGAKSRFGARWAHFDTDHQWLIIHRLLEEADENALRTWLKDSQDLTDEQVAAVLKARLPQGYGRFGETASRRLIAALEAEVIPYSAAVMKADLGHHSDFRTGEIFLDERGVPALPYYGLALERHIMPGTAEPDDPLEMRVGRLTNPTVHIGLNQLRKLVNRLIKAYGPPREIAIELARDLKLSEEEKKNLQKQNTKNRLEAEDRARKLEELRIPNTGANRARLKLWEELNKDNPLDRRCIYSGRQIGVQTLFSDAVEVDHILPFSRTLDDSNGNKILCLREANRHKRNQTPFEAWGHADDWEEISARASLLPKEKRWRFQPDAMARFEKDEGFLARQLVDTQYLSRLACEYLSCLYPDKGTGSGHVWVSPGRLTEIVRRKLGLNALLPDHNYGGGDQPKNRLDHRHHAIDAVVVGIVDRSLLQKMARASAQEGTSGVERIIVPEPWPDFIEDLRQALSKVIVSHRPDHGSVGGGSQQSADRLHNDTAYGLTGEQDPRGNDIVVHRVALSSLKPEHIEKVRDEQLRKALASFTKGKSGKDFDKALSNFVHLGPLPFRGIRRVRICEPLSVIPVQDDKGTPYKGYKGDSNYRFDVWELPDGKWRAEVVSMFDAHQSGWSSDVRASCPTARKVLSVHQDDIVAIEPEGEDRKLMRVVKFRQNGQITLAPPNEGGDLKRRNDDPGDPFKYSSSTAGGLLKLKARQVRIDELGRVQDPGFPARKTRRKTKPKSAQD